MVVGFVADLFAICNCWRYAHYIWVYFLNRCNFGVGDKMTPTGRIRYVKINWFGRKRHVLETEIDDGLTRKWVRSNAAKV